MTSTNNSIRIVESFYFPLINYLKYTVSNAQVDNHKTKIVSPLHTFVLTNNRFEQFIICMFLSSYSNRNYWDNLCKS